MIEIRRMNTAITVVMLSAGLAACCARREQAEAPCDVNLCITANP